MKNRIVGGLLMLSVTALYAATSSEIKRDYQRTQQLESRWQRAEQPARHSLRRELERQAGTKAPYDSLTNHPCQTYRKLVAAQATQTEQLTPATDSQRSRLSRQVITASRNCKKALR